MTPTRKRRMIAVLLILAGVGTAAIVATTALQDNLLFFVIGQKAVIGLDDSSGITAKLPGDINLGPVHGRAELKFDPEVVEVLVVIECWDKFYITQAGLKITHLNYLDE